MMQQTVQVYRMGDKVHAPIVGDGITGRKPGVVLVCDRVRANSGVTLVQFASGPFLVRTVQLVPAHE